MKSKLVIALFSSAALISQAQNPWTGTSLNGAIYRNGPVAIGLSSGANYVLDVNSSSIPDNGIKYQYTGTTGSAGLFLESTNSSKSWVTWATGSGHSFGSGNFVIHDNNAANPHLFISGATNKVGIGTASPWANLTVADPAVAEIAVVSTQANPANIARLLVSNTAMTYNFAVDANGNGSIGSVMELINFRYNYNNSQPNVWIGVKKQYGNHSDALFAVYGKMLAKSVYVNTSATVWSDYVFNTDYKLMPLESLEKYYKSNKHLPGVPTAKEVEANGDNLVETDAVLLKKIEELTLYVVQLKKEIEEIKKGK